MFLTNPFRKVSKACVWCPQKSKSYTFISYEIASTYAPIDVTVLFIYLEELSYRGVFFLDEMGWGVKESCK